MSKTKTNADGMRRLIDKMLLGKLPGNVHNFFNDLIHRCQAEGVPFDPKTAVEYWWHLARLGVVALTGAGIGALSPRVPDLQVTQRGRRLLERGESSPHDPPRYMEAVQRRVATPDDIALTYLDEAVGAWTAGLNRASAVMLGCACERLVLILANAIASAGVAPWAQKIQKELAGTSLGISRLFENVRKGLLQLAADKKLPGELADALDRKLSAIFDHARVLRNESGHPTGAAVSSEDGEAGLLLFPGFYALVDGLCKHLSPPS